jgi:hypothetical protein
MLETEQREPYSPIVETKRRSHVELLHFSHVSLVQWTNCLHPATGGSASCPGGANHTLELGLPVSGWSLITGYDRSSLLAVFAVTLATLLVPVLFSLQATDYGNIPLGSRKAHTRYCGGGGALWSSCISHTFTMSHWSSGLTVCFRPQEVAVRAIGVQPTLWNWDYLLELSLSGICCCFI